MYLENIIYLSLLEEDFSSCCVKKVDFTVNNGNSIDIVMQLMLL